MTLALALFLLLFLRVTKIAERANDSFSSLVAFGLLASWFVHVLVNVGMTLNLMPITGIPLPFFSYGGIFMLASWLAIGILRADRRRGPRWTERAVRSVSRALLRSPCSTRASATPLPVTHDAGHIVPSWPGSERRRSRGSRGASGSRFRADVWEKCEACGHTDMREKFVRNLNVCPNCDYHRRIRASDYCNILLDDGSIEELEVDIRSIDPLGFPGVSGAAEEGDGERRRRRRAARRDRARSTSCRSNLGVMDFAFMGGSMGSVVGEKIARLGPALARAEVSARSSSPPRAARACRKACCR